MSDVSTAPETAPQNEQAPGAPIHILAQFIKDLSFEVPHAPEIYSLLRQEGPQIPISLDTNVRQLEGATFEVTMTIHIEANLSTKKAFILELTYGAIAEVNPQVVPEEHIHPVLMIEVPRLIFPFVRQIVTDATVGGGFPPLMLQMFDFAELYRKKFGGGDQPAEPAPPVH